MTAPNEVYVDPSLAADSGTGSIGDPYGDLEFALESVTPNANGDRINIKAGTDEVLEFALDIVVDYGTPTLTAPLIFQGYTTAAGDNGKGGISGGGSVSITNLVTLDFVHFIDLHLHNCGSANIVGLDNDCSVLRCELNNTSGAGIDVDDRCLIMGNYLHDIGDNGIFAGSGSLISSNFLENGTKTFNRAIRAGQGACVYRNIISVGSNTDGINISGNSCNVINNSVWSNAGTGQGIVANNTRMALAVLNNLVEGFSGTGGVGFEFSGAGTAVGVYAGNSAFDNATEFGAPNDFTLDDWKGAGNETLSASPFTDAAAGDFNPIDTGAVKEGSLPDTFGEGQ